MPIIKIDEIDYDTELMSPGAKQQLLSIQFIDAELGRIQAQAAVLQTARQAYATVLKSELRGLTGETIKFS